MVPSDSADRRRRERSRWTDWSRRDRLEPRTRHLSRGSRLLHRIDHLSSLPATSLVVAAGLIASISLGASAGFSTGWETGFGAGTSVVTLLMVFVIQHTQSREQAATQRKLDELLRALPDAEPALMMLEEAPEHELREVENVQRRFKDGVQYGSGR